jgi:ABC-type branched-subunit amino acid transport system ATPase component
MSNRARIRGLIANYLRQSAATAIIVDHDVDFVSQLCPDLVVLSAGRVLDRGDKDTVLANPDVIRTFIGDSFEHADAAETS